MTFTLVLKPGFHISQFIGDLLSGIAEGENDFRNTRILSIVDHRQQDHKDIADELRYMKTRPKTSHLCFSTEEELVHAICHISNLPYF